MYDAHELANIHPSRRRAQAIIGWVMGPGTDLTGEVFAAGLEAFIQAWDQCYEVMVFAHMSQDARAREQQSEI